MPGDKKGQVPEPLDLGKSGDKVGESKGQPSSSPKERRKSLTWGGIGKALLSPFKKGNDGDNLLANPESGLIESPVNSSEGETSAHGEVSETGEKVEPKEAQTDASAVGREEVIKSTTETGNIIDDKKEIKPSPAIREEEEFLKSLKNQINDKKNELINDKNLTRISVLGVVNLWKLEVKQLIDENVKDSELKREVNSFLISAGTEIIRKKNEEVSKQEEADRICLSLLATQISQKEKECENNQNIGEQELRRLDEGSFWDTYFEYEGINYLPRDFIENKIRSSYIKLEAENLVNEAEKRIRKIIWEKLGIEVESEEGEVIETFAQKTSKTKQTEDQTDNEEEEKREEQNITTETISTETGGEDSEPLAPYELTGDERTKTLNEDERRGLTEKVWLRKKQEEDSSRRIGVATKAEETKLHETTAVNNPRTTKPPEIPVRQGRKMPKDNSVSGGKIVIVILIVVTVGAIGIGVGKWLSSRKKAEGGKKENGSSRFKKK